MWTCYIRRTWNTTSHGHEQFVKWRTITVLLTDIKRTSDGSRFHVRVEYVRVAHIRVEYVRQVCIWRPCRECTPHGCENDTWRTWNHVREVSCPDRVLSLWCASHWETGSYVSSYTCMLICEHHIRTKWKKISQKYVRIWSYTVRMWSSSLIICEHFNAHMWT